MRAPDLIETLLRLAPSHDVCLLLFQFEGTDEPLMIEFVENIELALTKGWVPVGLIFVDQIGREEVWSSYTFPGCDGAFMSDWLARIVEDRAEDLGVPLNRDGAGNC